MKALVLFLSVIILAYTFQKPAGSLTISRASTDSQFIQQASYMNLGEIVISNIAMMRGSGPVQRLGEQILQDHTAAQQQLANLAESLRYNINVNLDSGYEARAKQLKEFRGKTFDSVYLGQLAAGQGRAIAAFEAHAGAGTHRQLVGYAHTELSLLRQHRLRAGSVARLLFGAGHCVN